MALNARCHRLMPFIDINIFKQCRMTGHAITRTSPQGQEKQKEEKNRFHGANYATVT